MSAAHNMPWFEHIEVPDHVIDEPPMSWAVISTYILIIANTMASLVLVLVCIAWLMGVLQP